MSLSTTRSNHEIDYRIVGEEMQYVEVELDPSETAIAEAGSFMLMDDGITMQTIFRRWFRPTAIRCSGKIIFCRQAPAYRGKSFHDCLHKYRAG